MARLPGRAFAGVGLRDEFHERRADAAHDFCAAVRRTVVHDDDLCQLQRLGQHRTQGVADFAFLVVEGMMTEMVADAIFSGLIYCEDTDLCYICK